MLIRSVIILQDSNGSGRGNGAGRGETTGTVTNADVCFQRRYGFGTGEGSGDGHGSGNGYSNGYTSGVGFGAGAMHDESNGEKIPFHNKGQGRPQ